MTPSTALRLLPLMPLLLCAPDLRAAPEDPCDDCGILFSEHSPADYRLAPNSTAHLPPIERTSGAFGALHFQLKVVGGTAVPGVHFVDDFPRAVALGETQFGPVALPFHTLSIAPDEERTVIFALEALSPGASVDDASTAIISIRGSAVADSPPLPVAVTISSPDIVEGGVSNLEFIHLDIAFSEPVTGFHLRDLNNTNYTGVSLSGSGAVYQVVVRPVEDGFVKVAIPAGRAYAATPPFEATAHVEISFDSDRSPPIPDELTLFVNGVESSYAKAGDTLSIEIVMSEPTTTPSVSIAGRTASVSGSGTLFVATTTVLTNDPEGPADILLFDYADLVGNFGPTLNLAYPMDNICTEPIPLIIDLTPPVAALVPDFAARVGDTLTGRFGLADRYSGVASATLWIRKPGATGWEPDPFLTASMDFASLYPPLGEWEPDPFKPLDQWEPDPFVPLDGWEPDPFFDPAGWEPDPFRPAVHGWSYTPDAGPGVYRFAVVLTDLAGNSSPVPSGDSAGIAVAWNDLPNKAFSYTSIEGGTTYLFPMTNEQTIALEFTPGTVGGMLTVERKLGYPTDLSWPFLPPEPDIVLNEYLEISGSFTGGTATLIWEYDPANAPTFAGNFNTLYRFAVDGTLLDHFAAVPSGTRLTAPGVDGFSRWIAGLGVISSYNRWAETFELNTTNGTPGANPSGDGVPNLIKYALGLDPHQAVTDPTRLPVFSMEDLLDFGSGELETAPHAVFRFLRHLDRTDLNIRVEYSTDLNAWYPLPDEYDPDATFDGTLEPRRAFRPLTETAPNVFFRLFIEVL